MQHIFRFDIANYFKSKAFIIAFMALIGAGIFTGLRFNLTIGEGVYLNSAYSIGFMTGMKKSSIARKKLSSKPSSLAVLRCIPLAA